MRSWTPVLVVLAASSSLIGCSAAAGPASPSDGALALENESNGERAEEFGGGRGIAQTDQPALCRDFGHPSVLASSAEGGGISIKEGASDACAWPATGVGTKAGKVRPSQTGTAGANCTLPQRVPACGGSVGCCRDGRLTGGAPTVATPVVDFLVCTEVVDAFTNLVTTSLLCSLPVQPANAEGTWSFDDSRTPKWQRDTPAHHGSHDACWAEGAAAEGDVLQAHCHDGGELISPLPANAFGRECHVVTKGAGGKLVAHTIMVECGV